MKSFSQHQYVGLVFKELGFIVAKALLSLETEEFLINS